MACPWEDLLIHLRHQLPRDFFGGGPDPSRSRSGRRAANPVVLHAEAEGVFDPDGLGTGENPPDSDSPVVHWEALAMG